VRELLARGLVEAPRLRGFFEEIEPELYRSPALDKVDFRRGLEDVLGAPLE